MKYRYSLDDLRYFCIVAHFKSFKDAALALSVPLSTLSRRIRQLEDDLQLRLLNRDAHRVSLTHMGELYYQRSSALFAELDGINDDLHIEKNQPKGKIIISAPINAGSQFLRDIFYDFLLQYPEIQLDIRLSNTLIDIEAQAIDVVFRVGNTVVDNWIARPLKDIHFILCSNSQTVADSVKHPTDLCAKSAVICQPMSIWQLVNKQNDDAYDFQPSKGIRLELDEIQMLTHAVKKSLGIGYIPDYYALPMIAQGELQHVLPDWQSKARTLFMLYRDRDHLPLRVRLFIEYVLARFEQG